MIYIDFQSGSHGNYLEFVCNKYLADVPCNKLPFNKLGAAHLRNYQGQAKFISGHFSANGDTCNFSNSKIISIRITELDLLNLECVSFLRSGDYGIDIDQLEHDTYNKLNNITCYRPVLKNIMDVCFNHGLDRLDESHPDCPRYILREFYKYDFKFPEKSGLIEKQKSMVYDKSNSVYLFPYNSFYDQTQFSTQIKKLADWLDLDFEKTSEFDNLHAEFLKHQPYKDCKLVCDGILAKIKSRKKKKLKKNFPKLNLLQESYLTAQIELMYNVELPKNSIWFTNCKEILDCIKETGNPELIL